MANDKKPTNEELLAQMPASDAGFQPLTTPHRKMNVKFTVPEFTPYIIGNSPKGRLAKDPACHALMYYALTARKNQELEYDGAAAPNRLLLEGELDPTYDYRQLFRSVATMYGVTPERMVRFWDYVDRQFYAEGIPKLEGRARQDVMVVIRTQ